MKKNSMNFLIIVCTIVLFFTTVLTIIKINTVSPMAILPYEKQTSIDICKSYGTVKSSWLDKVNDQLSVIDNELLTQFQDDGWKILIVDTDLSKFDNSGEDTSGYTTLGLTRYDQKTIYIKASQLAINDKTVIHEFGHWYDFHYGMLSNTDEFKKVVEKEWHTFYDEFYSIKADNQAEMFAEGFSIYYTNTKDLKTKCSLLYEYMNKQFN